MDDAPAEGFPNPIASVRSAEEASTRLPNLVRVLEMAMIFLERDGGSDPALRTLVELILQDATELERWFKSRRAAG